MAERGDWFAHAQPKGARGGLPWWLSMLFVLAVVGAAAGFYYGSVETIAICIAALFGTALRVLSSVARRF